MIVGIPKEIKISENRVGMTEAGVRQLVKEGHTLFVEKDAGLGSASRMINMKKPAQKF